MYWPARVLLIDERAHVRRDDRGGAAHHLLVADGVDVEAQRLGEPAGLRDRGRRPGEDRRVRKRRSSASASVIAAVVRADDARDVRDRLGPLVGQPAEVAAREGSDDQILGAGELAVVVQEEGFVARERRVHQRRRVARRVCAAVAAIRDRAAAREVGVGARCRSSPDRAIRRPGGRRGSSSTCPRTDWCAHPRSSPGRPAPDRRRRAAG